MFFILVGISIILMKDRRNQAGQSDELIKKHVLRRGLFLICFGFIYNIIVEAAIYYIFPNFGFSPYSAVFRIYTSTNFWDWLFLWGIFHSIGLCYIISYFLLKVPKKTRLFIVIGILLFNLIIAYLPLINGQGPIHIIRMGWYYYPTAHPLVFLLDIFIYGQFPLIPWLSFVIIGTILGQYLKEAIQNNELSKFSKRNWKTGTIISLVGIGELILLMFPGFFPDSTLYVIFSIGISMLFFQIFYVYYELDKKQSKKIEILLIKMGKFSLTLYFFTGLLFVDLFLFLGLLLQSQLLGNLSIIMVMPLSFTCVFLFILISNLWEKVDYKYSLNWIEDQVTG